MAVAFQSASTKAVASGTSIAINKPSGVVDGDIMVAVIGFDDGGGAETIDSVPSGWTLIDDSLGTGPNIYTYYKVAGGSEGASYTWTKTGAAECAAGILRIDGQSAITPISFTDGGVVSNDDTPSWSATLTPPAANCMLIMAIMSRSTGGGVNHSAQAITTSNPTWTEAFDIKGGVSDDCVVSAAYAVRPELTATGNWSATTGNNSDATDSVSIMLCVAPRVDATTSPAVVASALSIQAPTATGGSNATPAVLALTSSMPTATAAGSAPKWVNPDKPTTSTFVNPDKS